jgi:hypothetical protein
VVSRLAATFLILSAEHHGLRAVFRENAARPDEQKYWAGWDDSIVRVGYAGSELPGPESETGASASKRRP